MQVKIFSPLMKAMGARTCREFGINYDRVEWDKYSVCDLVTLDKKQLAQPR